MFSNSKTILENTRFVFILFLLPALFGCSASTNFKPPSNHKAYLGMEKGEFTIIKDSISEKISDKPEMLLECNSLAQATAVKATKSFNTGQSLLSGGACLTALIPILSIVLTLDGVAKTHTGAAQLIDAMNIHNDQPDCLSPADQVEKKKFEQNLEHEELIIPTSIEILYNSTTTILNRQVRIRCAKKRESSFFSTFTLSFEGVIGIDKNQDGSFKRTSLKVEKDDKFYIRTKSLLLQVEVVQETDRGLTLTFQKQ